MSGTLREQRDAVFLVSRTEEERDAFLAAAQDIADKEGLLVQMDPIGSHESALYAAPAVLQRLTGHIFALKENT